MLTAQKVLYWFLDHWPDVVIAVVLAALADLLRIGSLIRRAIEYVKDKLAEGSIQQLNIRIAQQEEYRKSLQGYLASDKLLYLALLRSIVGILLFMSVAGVVLLIGQLGAIVVPVSELMALGVLFVSVVVSISTMQFGMFDSSKIEGRIKKLDAEILALKETREKLLNAKKNK